MSELESFKTSKPKSFTNCFKISNFCCSGLSLIDGYSSISTKQPSRPSTVPTIIVFYGDHLPYIVDSEGTDVIFSSNYINIDENYESLLRKFTTKAVMLSNYNIEFENIEYMNASYLGAYILNNMDLEISDYFKYIDSMRNTLPVFNRNSVLIKNKIYDINPANEEIKTALKNYEYVQYRSFYDIN